MRSPRLERQATRRAQALPLAVICFEFIVSPGLSRVILRAQLVNRVHEYTEMLGVYVGGYTVSKVENMAGALAVTGQRVGDALSNHVSGDSRNVAGSRLPCRATLSSTYCLAVARSVVQSTPSASQPVSDHVSEHLSRALREQYDRNPATVPLPHETVDDLLHACQ